MVKFIIYFSCVFFLFTGFITTTHAAEQMKTPLSQTEVVNLAQEDAGTLDEIVAGENNTTMVLGIVCLALGVGVLLMTLSSM